MITVHGRTRDQFYNGEADWRAVRDVREATRLPLVVNGDILSAETAADALAKSGADAVMVGRGAVGRPWLVGGIGRWLAGGARPADPDLQTQHAIAVEHYEACLTHYGRALGARMVRKHLAAYLDVASGGKADVATRTAVLTPDDPRHVVAALSAAYGGQSLARAA